MRLLLLVVALLILNSIRLAVTPFFANTSLIVSAYLRSSCCLINMLGTPTIANESSALSSCVFLNQVTKLPLETPSSISPSTACQICVFCTSCFVPSLLNLFLSTSYYSGRGRSFPQFFVQLLRIYRFRHKQRRSYTHPKHSSVIMWISTRDWWINMPRTVRIYCQKSYIYATLLPF